MFNPLPATDRQSIEIASGIFIPADRLCEFEQAINADPALAQAIEDVHTVLTEVAPNLYVQRCQVADWIFRMENDPVFCAAMDTLMDRLNCDGLVDEAEIAMSVTPLGREVLSRRRYSVATFALQYGIH